MRINQQRRWLAAVLCAVTLIAGVATFGLPSPAHADPGCQPGGVYVLFARGSGTGFNSNEAVAFHDHIFYALRAIGIGRYDWAELGNLDGDFDSQSNLDSGEYPAVAIDWTFLLNRSGYDGSVTIGTDELVRHLNQRYGSGPGDRNCYNETVVIGGYSQGADVVGWALERSGGGGYVSLTAAARSHIGFVALYGDPKNNHGCGIDRWWERGGNQVGCNHDGILGARNPYIQSDFRGRFGSWCDTHDGICTGVASGGNVIGNHTSVYKDWWIWQSAAEIANAASIRLGLLNPSQGGGVGGATYLGSDTLGVNQPMYKNQYVMSPDGNFVLILQSDGNLVLFGHRYQPLWSSNTSGQNVSHLVLQPDGNWVMYSPNGQPIWYNGMNGTAGTRIVVQADGNLVEYNATGQAAWHTNTGRAVPTLSYYGSDHLNANQALWQNQYLRSTNGTRFLQLQADGNLVLYGPGAHLLWHTNTGGRGITQAVMQPDGNLVLYAANGTAVWSNSGNGNNNAFVVMQPDGNLVQYAAAGYPMWWSGTAGQI